MGKTAPKLRRGASGDKSARSAHQGPQSSVPPTGKKSANIEKILPAKRAKLTTTANETLENDGFQLVTSNKDRKQINKRSAPSTTEKNAPSGMARPVGQFVIEMQKPVATVDEWKSVLEQGFRDCPRNYFQKCSMSTNPKKRSELKRCVEVYLSLLNGNSDMFQIFFAQEETGYELADPTEKDSSYINFRLLISAYVLNAAAEIMKEYIKINNKMKETEEGDWQASKNSATQVWRYTSPFTWQFVRYEDHSEMLNRLLDIMDHGGEAWSEMMAESVQDFVDCRFVLESSAHQTKFEAWAEFLGLREFGRTVRDPDELKDIEIVRAKARKGPRRSDRLPSTRWAGR